MIHYFHQVDDPYSALAVRALPHLLKTYGVEVTPHLVPPPDRAAAPDAERLEAWSRRDALDLAEGLGLEPTWAQALDKAWVAKGEAALAGLKDPLAFATAAMAIASAFRDGTPERIGPATGDAKVAKAEGNALREKRGHYLGGTFFYESEWFWGLDRLNFLEERLRPHVRAGEANKPFVPRREVTLTPGPLRRRPEFHAFISFRSPYTWIAMPRIVDLARAYDADLRLRFVLPMVMRGLPVPLSKRLYIVRDTKREAERLGLPFGKIADPVGAPAERGLAVLHHAIKKGRGPDFALSFLKGVFAEGIDAGTAEGLKTLCARAGIDNDTMRAALLDESWRAVAEANRTEMFESGLWGVPSFRVDDKPARWGQDRLWRVEEDLRQSARGEPT